MTRIEMKDLKQVSKASKAKKARQGFRNYDEAEYNNQITEWELSTVLSNNDYLKSCIFHNGKVQFKKRIIWNSVM
jgi:hypothetical protein